jgi:hypothetical protein
LADFVTTDQEDTLDLKARLFTEHANLSEGVLSESFESLNETLEKVLEHILNLTFLTDLLVVKEPE